MMLRLQAGTSATCFRLQPEIGVGVICLMASFQLLAGVGPDPGFAPGASSLADPQPFVSALSPRAGWPVLAPAPDLKEAPVTSSTVSGPGGSRPVTNALPAQLLQVLAPTNGLPAGSMSPEELMLHYARQLELARQLRITGRPREAEPLLIEMMNCSAAEPIKQTALLELAAVARDENDLTRAEQIYAQFLTRWPNDLRVPEVLLRQGLIFRQMGLDNLAFNKFYGVMTSALVLKNDQLDYYVRLVLQAQVEIAETQYALGRYADAAEFFSRLLKQNNPAINRPQILYKLARCHAALGKYSEAVADAEDFLAHYPDAPEQPEIRFHLALALNKLGRNNESLQQVLLLLQEQHAQTLNHPELWAYWQQRTGNLIANQLYREGDYTRALQIYLNLTRLNAAPQWQLPVLYQIGMTYERLLQPQKAAETYTNILAHEKELGTNAPPGLETLFDMARWRINFLQWQNRAEAANRRMHEAIFTDPAGAGNQPPNRNPLP